MFDFTERTALLLGEEALEKLAHSRVAVFGIGGVGSYTAEALCRSGVGILDLTDNDTVSLSNINRQLFALHSTVGRYKVDVAAERLTDINPACTVIGRKTFLSPQTIDEYDFSQYSCVVDAIDNVTGKLLLAERCTAAGVPLISSMGTGNKLNAEALTITDIAKTSVCPLARVMRRELKQRGILHLPVLFSAEEPVALSATPAEPNRSRPVPGSTAFVPSVAGLLLAGWVVRTLTEKSCTPLS